MSKPTSNWEKIGNRFYRKVKHYTAVFDHDLELENYLIAGAPYGGAVRLNRPSLSFANASSDRLLSQLGPYPDISRVELGQAERRHLQLLGKADPPPQRTSTSVRSKLLL
jgi:hypothetical protein